MVNCEKIERIFKHQDICRGLAQRFIRIMNILNKSQVLGRKGEGFYYKTVIEATQKIVLFLYVVSKRLNCRIAGYYGFDCSDQQEVRIVMKRLILKLNFQDIFSLVRSYFSIFHFICYVTTML